jgi:type IV pilus assembly protein PilA
MYRQISHGFVLIELMQVLAILSILVVVALPAYKDYTLRAIVSEGLEAVLPLREKIEEYYAHHGRFPKHNSALAMPPIEQLATKYLQGIQVKEGVIIIHYRNRNLERDTEGILTLRPALNMTLPTAPIIWACGESEPADRIVIGDNLTNLDKKLLPAACRN